MSRSIGLFISVSLAFGLVACSHPSSSAPRTLAEFERAIAGKNEREIARFVFETYNCTACHILGARAMLGFTPYGEQRRKQSEGCVPLLAAMNVIVRIPESERTPQQRARAARFEEFGCTFCHRIIPGQLGLTEIGAKLASLHLSCSGIQKTLTAR